MNPNQAVQNLANEFVRLRQNNYTPEEAWQITRQLAANLDSGSKRQLSAMVQGWEARYGHQFRPSDHQDSHSTMTMYGKPPTEQTKPMFADDQAELEYFGDDTRLLIYVIGIDQPYEIDLPSEQEVAIGRAAPDSVLLPDIDLGPVGGDKLGVSRTHASLRRENNRLLIADLGSKNKTHINGQRLHVQEVRVLRDGDEIRFGNLLTRIRFHRPR